MPLEFIYASQPGERLRLLQDGSTLVVHPDRPPFLVMPDGKIEPLTCPSVVDHNGELIVAHQQTIYFMSEGQFPPREVYRQ